MEDDQLKQERIRAILRLLEGESQQAICTSLKRSKSWLYKWLERHLTGGEDWNHGRTHRPGAFLRQTSSDTDEIVKMIRLNLYNRDLFCGAQAIRWEMEDQGFTVLPSIRTINRILSREGLTHRRTGLYEPKGKAYPKLPAVFANQTHQADLVGPCYLKGPVRFYSYNVVDTLRAGAVCSLHVPKAPEHYRRRVGHLETAGNADEPASRQRHVLLRQSRPPARDGPDDSLMSASQG